MHRILITGNSGSGKSTMAAQIAAEYGIPHLDLDTLAWESPGVRRPLDDSVAAIRAFFDRNPEWVIEGCYAQLLEAVLPDATELRFLNPGVEACIGNCRSRPWEPHKYPSVEAQNQNLEMLIRWVRKYETRDDEFSLRRHRQLFAEFDGEKVEYTDNIQMPNKAMHRTREDARG
jgi:adenylate kinase family enzyme